MSSPSSKRKTRRLYSSDEDDSPVYKKYIIPDPTAARIRQPESEFQFQIFVPPDMYLMRVKSKTYPNTEDPYRILREVRRSFSTKIPYELAYDLIKTHVKSGNCKELRKGNAIESASESNIGIIVKTREDEMVGFATIYFAIKDRGEESTIDHVFVDILCGHPGYTGIGTAILDYIKQSICEPLDIKRIELESITESLGFYLKKGFQCNPCKMRLTLKSRKR